MRVDFMIIGAQKSATTSIANQLSLHSQVCFCDTKEPHYFSKTTDWKSNIRKYHKLYSPLEGQLCGEASTSYTLYPSNRDVARKIHEYNPKTLLIYIVRDPVTRIKSHYIHRLLKHATKYDKINEEVLNDPTYINASRYGVQIRQYLRFFEKAQIKLVLFDEYVSNPLVSLNSICDFLNITPPSEVMINASPKNVSAERNYSLSFPAKQLNDLKKKISYTSSLIPTPIKEWGKKRMIKKLDAKPKLSNETQRILWTLLEEDVNFIEKEFDLDLTLWKKKYALLT